jgi:hypothetical protein
VEIEVTDRTEERRQVREAVSELFLTGSQATVEEFRAEYPLAFQCFSEAPERFWSYLDGSA